ncbi:MAG: ABC transporter ATP-binding protein [Gammaproteobacteria bacterium]|nr:ABC transporter ATP-binding protein [Gammaproteobacteria bacterium]
MAQSHIIEVRDLHKRFGNIHAVRGISFDVPTGQCMGLLGHNGAGKTTTVEMLEGITRPDSGTIRYKGKILNKDLRNEAGIMFQHTALQDFITVDEALQLFAGLYPDPTPLDDLVKQFQLKELLGQETRKLSGGQRQRLLLAIALINNPDIIFLDEPTTGLDPHARQYFWSLIREIRAQGKTVILTTHYMEEAYALCDEIIIMNEGSIMTQGTPDALLRKHFNDVVLTLPLAVFSEDQKKLFKVYENRNIAEILTQDIDQEIRGLMEAGLELKDLRIRERTLEDLFLTLTEQNQ